MVNRKQVHTEKGENREGRETNEREKRKGGRKEGRKDRRKDRRKEIREGGREGERGRQREGRKRKNCLRLEGGWGFGNKIPELTPKQ